MVQKQENHPNKTQKFSARAIVERLILSTHFAKMLEYEVELSTSILLPPGESLRRKQSSRGKRARDIERKENTDSTGTLQFAGLGPPLGLHS